MSNNQIIYFQEAPSYIFPGVNKQIHLSGEQTGGEFSLIGDVIPPGGDGGLHVHLCDDESVHLLNGDLQITIGQQTFTLTATQIYFAPRNIPHQLKNPGKVPALTLLINTRRIFDKFVSIAGALASQDASTAAISPVHQLQRLLALADEFRVKMLAPSGLLGRI